MTSAVETFRGELFARVLTADYGAAPTVERIRRTRRTIVARDTAPAIYVSFPQMEPVPGRARSCNWEWTVHFRIAIYTADDDGDAAADPYVAAVLAAINPTAAPTTDAPLYSNGVTLEPPRVRTLEDVADEDVTRVDIEGVARISLPEWSIEV